MKYFGFIFLTACFLLSSSCFMSPKGHLFYGCIDKDPDKNEIVGTWIADKETLKDMSARGSYTSFMMQKLIFHENGKLEMLDLPDWWNKGDGKSFQGFESYEGNWEFSRQGASCAEVNIHYLSNFTNLNFLESRFGAEPKYIITKYIGDPDSDNMTTFVKEK